MGSHPAAPPSRTVLSPFATLDPAALVGLPASTPLTVRSAALSAPHLLYLGTGGGKLLLFSLQTPSAPEFLRLLPIGATRPVSAILPLPSVSRVLRLADGILLPHTSLSTEPKSPPTAHRDRLASDPLSAARHAQTHLFLDPLPFRASDLDALSAVSPPQWRPCRGRDEPRRALACHAKPALAEHERTCKVGRRLRSAPPAAGRRCAGRRSSPRRGDTEEMLPELLLPASTRSCSCLLRPGARTKEDQSFLHAHRVSLPTT